MWFVALAALVALIKLFHERLCKIFGGKYATGEQRRKIYPPTNPNSHPLFPCKLLRDDISRSLEMTWHVLDGMPSRPSGTRLFYQKIAPKSGTSKLVVNLVHGLGAHSDGAMKNIALMLAHNLGATIFVLDQYGNGRSDGLHGYIPSYRAVVEDLIYFVEKVVRPAAALANVSVFGYGISLGGGLTTHLCIQRPDLYDGAILECPAVAVAKGNLPPWIAVQVINLLSWVMPAAPLIPSKITIEKVFKEEEMRAAAEQNDSLQYKSKKQGLRIRTGTELMRMCVDLGANDWQIVKEKLVTPLLIIHGDKDEVCPIEGSRALMANAATRDKALHVVRDGLHALMAGEPPNVVEGLLDRVTKWISERKR